MTAGSFSRTFNKSKRTMCIEKRIGVRTLLLKGVACYLRILLHLIPPPPFPSSELNVIVNFDAIGLYSFMVRLDRGGKEGE